MRRVVFYLFFDPQGQVDDFVLHTLRHLRSHAEHVFVVSNGELDGTASSRLSELADTCLLYTSPSPRDGLLSRMPSSA